MRMVRYCIAATRAMESAILSSQAFVGLPLRLRPAVCASRRRRPSSARAGLPPVPLPKEFGYVILTAASSAFLVQWQAFQVGMQRKKSGVPYPKMYEEAEPSVFNCYQRAHQNTLESYPTFLALLAIGGLAYPKTCSVLGMIWVVGRLLYSLGYYTGDPKNRMRGMFHLIGFLGLFITSIVFGIRQTGLLGG